MENTIKEQIKLACAQATTLRTDKDYQIEGYEVQNNGDIVKNSYVITSLTGCSWGMRPIHKELIATETLGNCDNLSFLE